MFIKQEEDSKMPLLAMSIAYENTPADSDLCNAIVDIFAQAPDSMLKESITGPETEKYWVKEICLDVMAIVLEAWKEGSEFGPQPRKEKCHYHIHSKCEHC